jgi:2-polyprenyl-3-methyl-5-hydroxy-6-metoxy-1,4-benzoquinol methylase
VEPIESYVKYASGRWEGIDPDRLRMVAGFAEDLAELDLEPVDWILSNDVLHHVRDLTATGAAVAALARPWARWLAIEPNPQNPWVIWYHTRTAGEQVFNERGFVAAATSTGWQLTGKDHLFLVPQAIKSPPAALVAMERALERLPVISGGTALHLVRTPIE